MNGLESLFARYRGKRLLLDSNLLLLYLIGTLQRGRIATFKRTAHFNELHFDILVLLMAQFRIIVTTPHILTEVSSLANALPSSLKAAWAQHFKRRTSAYEEVFVDARTIMLEPAFDLFGLADAAIHLASPETLVLTEDSRLSGFLDAQGVATLNLTNLVATLRNQQPSSNGDKV